MHIIKDLLLMTFGYCLDTDLLKKLCLYLVILFAQDLFSHIKGRTQCRRLPALCGVWRRVI